MRVVQFETSETGSPDSPAWHAWRALGLGGSDAVIIAAGYGLIPRSAVPAWVPPLEQLLAEKRGEKDEEVRNAYAQFYMERGKAGERRVREHYENTTGMIVAPMFAECDDEPFVRCSFDAVSIDALRITEIKIPGEKARAIAKEGKVPAYYLPQLAHQAMVAWGTDPDLWPEDGQVDYVSGVAEDSDEEPIIVPVPAADLAELAKSLILAERAFWRAVTGDGMLHGPEFAALIAAYDAADAAQKAAEAEVKAAKDRLEAFYRDYPFGRIEGCGRALDLETRAGSVDYEALIASLGVTVTDEMKERFRKKSSTSFTIRSRGRKFATPPGPRAQSGVAAA